MGFFKNKNLKRQVAMVFTSALLFTSVLHASSLTKKIDATFKNIKVYYNQQQKQMADEPFIYDNRVYLPVRAVSELIGQDVDWNGATNSVSVSGSNTNEENQNLILENARLKGENDILKSKLDKQEEAAKPSKGSLADTLEYLEDMFAYEHNIDWSFDLKETRSRIDVTVSFDSRFDDRRWEALSITNKENLFREISREIRIDHKDVTIRGEVLDSRTKNLVASFSYSDKNRFEYKDERVHSLSQLNKDLTKKYHNYKIKDSNIRLNNIILEGDEDTVIFTLEVNLNTRELEREWEDLVAQGTNLRNLLLNIQDDIRLDYRFADVDGYVKDYAHSNRLLLTFENSNILTK